MSVPYIKALEGVGAIPMILPLGLSETTLRASYDRLDGLFMAGGGDLNPACYRKNKYIKTEGLDDLRDLSELTLLRWALEDGKPILGVCRGLQSLNVAAGGTLMQDVGDMVPNAIRHQYYPEKPRNYVAHDIDVTKTSRLGEILGTSARVNSFHHQAAEQIASGFAAVAFAPDGVIEALEYQGAQFAIGVQWHPESLVETDPAMKRLFQAFIDTAVA